MTDEETHDECPDCRYCDYDGYWPTENCPYCCNSKAYIDLWMRRVEAEILDQ